MFDGAQKPVKDPDVRVREAIALVFAKFRETWSMRQTPRWFRDNEVEVPTNKARGGKFKIVFQLPTQTWVSEVLHNLFYATRLLTRGWLSRAEFRELRPRIDRRIIAANWAVKTTWQDLRLCIFRLVRIFAATSASEP